MILIFRRKLPRYLHILCIIFVCVILSSTFYILVSSILEIWLKWLDCFGGQFVFTICSWKVAWINLRAFLLLVSRTSPIFKIRGNDPLTFTLLRLLLFHILNVEIFFWFLSVNIIDCGYLYCVYTREYTSVCCHFYMTLVHIFRGRNST